MNRQWFQYVLLVLCLASLSAAAPFYDDFSTDTSGNYTGTRTSGTGTSSFNVSNGGLNLVSNGATTYCAFHNTARLEAGDVMSVVSYANNPFQFRISISTIPRGPNTGTESGIRFYVPNAGSMGTQIYRGGVVTNIDNAVNCPLGVDLTFLIFRHSETMYSVGYHDGTDLVIVNDAIEIAQTAGVAGMYVGVEAYNGSPSFDNLRIQAGVSAFRDDFSTDTSGNYVGTRTYGTGDCSFDVSGGTLNVDVKASTTYSVFHRMARLEVGQTVSIASVAANPLDLYLTVSTTSRSPNIGTESGIRFQWMTNGTFRTRVYRGGAETNYQYSNVVIAGPKVTFYISRDSETMYSVGYDAGSGFVLLDDSIHIPQTATISELHVGIEEYGSRSKFDNLKITQNDAMISARNKGPYLIYTGLESEMQILWQLTGALSCVLEWGTTRDYADGRVTTIGYGSDHQHRYTMTGLKAGFRYYYRLTVDEEVFTGSFTAAPLSFAENSTLYAFGGTRTNPDVFDQVCAAIMSELAADSQRQTLVLHTGDRVDSGTEESDWDHQCFPDNQVNVSRLVGAFPIMGSFGQLDRLVENDAEGLCRKYFPYAYANEAEGLFNSFDYGPVHVVVLDQYSTNPEFGTAQLQWLENDLATTRKKWKIIVLNAPGWSAGKSPLNNWSTENSTAVQQLIQPLCVQYGVDLVLGGRNHYYARCVVNGVHHITIAAAGAPYDSPGPDALNAPYLQAGPHLLTPVFCRIDIRGDRLAFEAIDAANGLTLDSFGIHRGLPGDCNFDGTVDLFDFSILAAAWMACDMPPDFNSSGRVDFFDLAIMADHYLIMPQEQDSDFVDITEFMAENSATLVDEDGDTPDWIELFNGDSIAVNLYNWYLTDDLADLTKWPFPSIQLLPKEFLVVFASGKDKKTVGGQLHTNFTLPQNGGYLALVKPDGTTIVRKYTGQTYPDQQPDTSFGLFMEK